MHGDKAQHDRTKALSLFKDGKCPLMVGFVLNLLVNWLAYIQKEVDILVLYVILIIFFKESTL